MDIKPRSKPRRSRRPPRYPDLGTYFAQTHDTQAAVADAVHVTQPHISRILRGQVVPRPALMRALAEHCHVPIDSFLQPYLADEEPDPSRRPGAAHATSRPGPNHHAADDKRR
jgi:transcriptional regulator with XRE-family HTH domain